MKDQQTGIMEKDIFSAENSPPQPPIEKKDKKNKLFNFFKKTLIDISSFFTKTLSILKKPKIATIIALLFIIGGISIALLSLSNKPNNTQFKKPEIQPSPSPSPVANEQLQKIKDEVNTYILELDSLETDFNNLQFPEVNLDFDFDF